MRLTPAAKYGRDSREARPLQDTLLADNGNAEDLRPWNVAEISLTSVYQIISRHGNFETMIMLKRSIQNCHVGFACKHNHS